MMFGNVAPAPVSFTWAEPGAARAAEAASATTSAGQRVCILRGTSSWLERELRLEQGLRADRILRHQGCPLEADVVPVAEQPPVGGELIRYAADEPSLLVGRASRLGVLDIHAGDDSRLRVGEFVDTERAVDVTIADRGRWRSGTHRPVPSRGGLGGERELLRSIGYHREEPIAVPAASRLAVLCVAGDAQPADTARVIGVEHAKRGPGTHVLALVARRPVVVLAVHDHHLEVHLVRSPLAVHACAEIGGCD